MDGVFSQARRFGDVETMARDVISLMLGVPKESFDIDVEPILGSNLSKRVSQMRRARADAETARRHATRVTAETAAALVESELTARDAGQILGLSFQRVAQLVEAARSG